MLLHLRARKLNGWAALALSSVIASAAYASPATSSQAEYRIPAAVPSQTLLVGTWTDGAPAGLPADTPAIPSKGLYRVRLNPDGSLLPLDVLALDNPSWTVLSKDGRFIYVTNEDNRDASGRLTAIKILADGKLQYLNAVDSHGQQPTHAALSPDGKFLFAANYSARPGHASVSVFPVAEDGHLGEMVQNLAFIRGSGAIPERQQDGHAHSITFSPDGSIAYLADLGADLIRAYHYDPNAPQPLKPWPNGDIKFPAASGPRHLLFSADGLHAYATTEMGASVWLLKVEHNRLKLQQQYRLTDSDKPEDKGGAGLVFSPDGKYLYVGNRRNSNQILAYAIKPASGELQLIGRYAAAGREPRAFAIDASGHYLLVADVFTNNVSEFIRDPTTGTLTPTRVALQLGLPTDIQFIH